ANFRKVMALAIHLDVEVTVQEVDVYSGAGQHPSFLELNPLGQIPTLVDNGVVLSESNAIAIYLAERYGEGLLYGTNALRRAGINRWLFWEASHWQRILAEVMGPQVGHRLLPDVVPKPEYSVDWNSVDCHKQLTFLDDALKTEWIAGAELSIADFCVGGMTTYFAHTEFPFSKYQNIRRWYDALNRLPSWSATLDALWA
ncbi:MAG: glutathione S-transferase family protein, partial [Pseudomonadota bacterium]